MSDGRPGFTISRCCRTCHYFEGVEGLHELDAVGLCDLGQVTDPEAITEKTYAIMVCDAHTWRATNRIMLKWAVNVGAYIPDDIL